MLQSQRAPSDGARSAVTSRDLEAAFGRHKGKMALCFVAIITAVTAWTIFCPRTYRAEAKLLLRLGRENMTVDPTAMSGAEPVLAMAQLRENELNSVAEVLRSRVLLDRVVDAIGPALVLGGGRSTLEQSGPATQAALAGEHWADRLRTALFGTLSVRDQALLQLSKNMDVSPVHRTDIISVSYQAPTAELAQQVTAKLVDFYLEEHLRVNRSQGAHQFLSEETKRIRGELSKAEQRLRDAKNEMGLASAESQQQMLVARIGRLEDDLLKAESDLAVSQARAGQLEETLAKLPASEVLEQVSGFTNEGTDNMRGQYYALQLRVQELAAKYHENHPLLQEARRNLAEAARALEQEQPTRSHATTGRSKAYEQAELALVAERPVLVAGQAHAAALRGQVAEAHRQLKILNDREQQLVAMQREIQLLEGNYRRSASNLEQARIDQALENQRISNISVAQPAVADLKPVSPRPLQNLALGLALAVFTSLGLVLVAARREQRAMDGAEIPQRGQPTTLTTVERMPNSPAESVENHGRLP